MKTKSNKPSANGFDQKNGIPLSLVSDNAIDNNDGTRTLSSDSGDLDFSSNTFEDLLAHCGEAGWWQLKVYTSLPATMDELKQRIVDCCREIATNQLIRVFLLASFCGFCTALHNLVYAFIGAKPDHWCSIPDVPGYSYEEIKNLTIPPDKDGNFETCMYRPILDGNGSSVWNNGGFSWNRNGSDIPLGNSTHCSQVDFDQSEFKNTIVTEWNLVCGDGAWASTVQAMYMIGILCGSPIFGAVSDKLGRKKAILIATLIFVVSGPLVALSPDFSLMMLARFIMAASSPGIYGTSFVLVIEGVGPSWRGLAGNLFCLPFAFGYMVLPGVAYYIREWRMLQLVLCAPSFVLFLTWWFLPESPRWLLRKGRVVEAEAILRQMASSNKRKKALPSNFSDLVQKIAEAEREEDMDKDWKSKVSSVFDGYANLVRSPAIRRRTLVLYFSWMSISMVYYGVALNAPNLSTDRYVYTLIGGILEIPSYFMVPPLIKLFGRRPVFSGFLLICSASLLSSLLFHDGSIGIVILAQFGKLLIGGAYALIYLYATELMPTLLRTYGVGTASMVGRVGSATAPYIVDLLGEDNKTYPTIVFGTMSLLAGLLSLLLPETSNKRLPETVMDIENDNL